jgi:TldD protein
MKTTSLIPCVAFLAGIVAAPIGLGADEDVVLKALKDEMARSIERLQMENVERPFYVSYVLDESDVFSCSSAFGALLGSGRSPSRSCAIDVRVGSFDLDNTNFARGGGGAAGVSLPEDDDYGAIRQNLWLVTDRRYKDAVEELAAKKAWLQTNVVTDRPADWTVVPPLEHIEPKRALTVDEAKMKELTRALSARFTSAAKIQSSSVSLRAAAENRTLLSTEGFHTRTGETWFRLSVTAGTQADDGMPVGDVRVFYGRSAADFPPEADMIAAVDDMIAKLTARTSAPRAEEYIGPVLFEGDAACQVLSELLVQRLSDAHEPLGSRDAGSPFKNRLKKRIAPPFLTVVDDPSQRSFEGTPLLGAFDVDHDGVEDATGDAGRGRPAQGVVHEPHPDPRDQGNERPFARRFRRGRVCVRALDEWQIARRVAQGTRAHRGRAGVAVRDPRRVARASRRRVVGTACVGLVLGRPGRPVGAGRRVPRVSGRPRRTDPRRAVARRHAAHVARHLPDQ